MGVARGGIPVASSVASALNLPWDVAVARKLPVPWYPQAGFGAVTSDGSVVLNESMLCSVGMTEQDVEKVIHSMRHDAARQAATYSSYRQPEDISGRHVVIVDDALISGYTMLATIKYARAHNARKVTVAAPVASRHAAELVEEAADECLFEEVSPSVPFSVADFYLYWPTLEDEDILPLLSPDHAHR